MTPHTTPILATLTATVLLLGACSPASPPTDTPAPTATVATTTSSPTPSPSPSPSPSNKTFPDSAVDDSEEIAAVRAGWEKYASTMQELHLDPSITDLTDISITTTGEETARAVRAVTEFRGAGYTTSGFNVYRDVKITKPKKNADGVVTSTVTYCSDPANLVTRDKDGDEVELGTTSATVTMEQLPDKSWRAAIFQNEKKKC